MTTLEKAREINQLRGINEKISLFFGSFFSFEQIAIKTPTRSNLLIPWWCHSIEALTCNVFLESFLLRKGKLTQCIHLICRRILTVPTADEFYCAMGELSQEMLEFTTAQSDVLIKVSL